MCGIAGVLDADGRGVELVAGMNRAQTRRGPDHASVAPAGPFVLGNTRLAIRDLTPAGNQPFTSPDGSITAVFNGEIYNFRQLATAHGIELRSGCDGEIIPALWAREGPACLARFRGMFAIALVDQRAGRLFLARDPFGIKPLHWRREGATVAFASDVRVLESFGAPPDLDPATLWSFLRFGSIPADRSPFAGVEAVAPGVCISIGADGQVRDEARVPALDPSPDGSGITAARALGESIRLHLEADVPTALLLSAGVDSSLLAAAAARLGQRLHCLTVAGLGPADESAIGRATAAHYGHRHTTVRAEIDEGIVDAFLASMQRPTIDGLNTFLVCRAVRAAGYKVALSGLGADEAVGGYRLAASLRWLPALRSLDQVSAAAAMRDRVVRGARSRSLIGDKAARLVLSGGPRSPEGVVRLQRELFPVSTVEALLGRRHGAESRDEREGAVYSERPGPRDGYARMAAAELTTYLQPMLLADADAFSMASSVELRVPYVDRAFFAAATRDRRPLGKEGLVRELGDGYLRRLARRPKSGFSLPMRGWLEDGVLRHVVAEACSPTAPVWSHLDRRAGLPILRRAGASPRWSEPWAIAVLDGWLRRNRS
ncbi:asparagine synthase (glutamine-hydrolyzing) [Rhabdothermincola sp.]|uniref:asparagine synthase (glutamine-hydrolyzing) n=1 Tax=Rhabdothermincola sp. TaxID=2820405 RepID=UPI002FE3F333